MAFSWQGFFLETYRCLEKMFAMPRLHQLFNELPASLPPHDVAEILERVLAWRPREEEALAGVLRRCDVAVLNDLLAAFGLALPAEAERAAAAAHAVYAARNGTVHFRPAHNGAEISVDDWDRRLAALITCVEAVYHRDGDNFHEVATATATATAA